MDKEYDRDPVPEERSVEIDNRHHRRAREARDRRLDRKERRNGE